MGCTTVVPVTATPDAVYYSTQGQWGAMFYDSSNVSSLEITVNEDNHVGSYFIDESIVEGFTVTPDIE